MSERLHILVIEDDREIQVLIERTVNVLLKAFHGSVITPVATWTEALTALSAKDKPDVAIVDLGLPDSEPSVMVSNLQQIESVCPVVVVTGHASEADILAIRQMGIEVILKREGFAAQIVRAISGILISQRIKRAELASEPEAQSLRENIRRIKEIVALLPLPTDVPRE